MHFTLSTCQNNDNSYSLVNNNHLSYLNDKEIKVLQIYPKNEINILLQKLKFSLHIGISSNKDINTKNISNLVLAKYKINKLLKLFIKLDKKKYEEEIKLLHNIKEKIDNNLYYLIKILKIPKIKKIKINNKNITDKEIIDSIKEKIQ